MEQISLQKNTRIGNQNRVRLLYFLFAFCVSGFLTAQNVINPIDANRNQWFIGLGLGPRMYFADHAKQLDFKDRISIGTDLYLGKWWSPLIATRVGGSWQQLKGATKYGKNFTMPGSGMPNPGHAIDSKYYPPVAQHFLYRQRFDAWHLYADVLLDVSTLFQGVNYDRFWTLAPFVGAGYISTWNQPSAHEITFNVGLMNKLRVGNNVDVILDIRGAAFKDRFKNPVRDPNPEPNPKDRNRLNNDTGERPYDGILSVNLGVAFRFGGNSEPKAAFYYPHIESVAPVEIYSVEVITEWKDVATDVLIIFRINQSTLLRDARVQLDFLARLMRQYPEGTYTITGYADEGTGNPDLNYRLSQARAERVKDCLVGEFGIAAERLSTVAAGGIENRFYDDPALSRSAIIRPDRH